jgi:integrase
LDTELGDDMSRTLKDAALGTRTERARLKPRGKPYFRAIEEGVHIGYRKPRGRKGKPAVSGKWVLRRFVEGQVSKKGKKQPYVIEQIGIADDFTDADGAAVLNFAQAQNRARATLQQEAQAKVGGPYTVETAIDDYFLRLEHEGKDTSDARSRAGVHIIPRLGAIDCNKITAKQIRNWLSAMASSPGRARPKGNKPNFRKFDPDDADEVRKRQASANRVFNILRGALNHGFEEGDIDSNREWSRVKPFKGVDVPRLNFLTVAEATRLINTCDREFRPAVEIALTTGARYGEICLLEVRDFDRDAKTLTIRKSKSKKVRTIFLGNEGVQLFTRLTAGRLGAERIVRTSDGKPFKKSFQVRRMKEACHRAKITPAIGFHELRHSYASFLVKAGTPMRYIADVLGHSSTKITDRYSHLVPSDVAKTIRNNVPEFGLERSKVVSL